MFLRRNIWRRLAFGAMMTQAVCLPQLACAQTGETPSSPAASAVTDPASAAGPADVVGSENATPEWVRLSHEVVAYVEKHKLVLNDEVKRTYQQRIDAATGADKLNLMYFRMFEATMHNNAKMRDAARPAYVAEMERQNSDDHRALLVTMEAFLRFMRGGEDPQAAFERLAKIHQDTALKPETRARALIIEGFIHSIIGSADEIVIRLHQAQDLTANSPADPYFINQLKEYEAYTMMLVKNYDEMMPLVRDTIWTAHELGLLISGTSVSTQLAAMIAEEGYVDALEDMLAANNRISDMTGNPHKIRHAAYNCGAKLLAIDQTDAALQCLLDADSQTALDADLRVSIDLRLATAYARKGEGALARQYYDRAVQDGDAHNHVQLKDDAALGRADVLHAEGEYEEAYTLQRRIHADMLAEKSRELGLVAAELRGHSQKQAAAQAEQQRLLEANVILKDKALFNLRLLTFVGLLLTLLAVVAAIYQRRQSDKLRLARREAVEASRAKSQFLANMSHEIRTPMNGVLGMAEVLQNSGLNETQKDCAKIIETSGNALMVILNDILDYSKIEAGKMDISPVPFDLKETIEDVATLLNETARRKSLETIVRYAPNLPQRLVGDDGRLRQIIMNLASNAIKFTTEGYVFIDVSGEITGDSAALRIEVIDTGIGVSEEQAATIFREFTQADGSTTRRFGGTGLGLTISRNLVEIMGGEIGVDSVEGEGSTFWFTLELPIAATSPAPQTADSPALHGRRILILDDLQPNLDLLEGSVVAAGADAFASSDPNQAVSALREATRLGRPFDLALVDYRLAQGSGLAVAKHIHQDTLIAPLPVLLMAADDLAAYESKLAQIGVVGICAKPVRTAALISRIAKASRSTTPNWQNEGAAPSAQNTLTDLTSRLHGPAPKEAPTISTTSSALGIG